MFINNSILSFKDLKITIGSHNKVTIKVLIKNSLRILDLLISLGNPTYTKSSASKLLIIPTKL